MAHVSKVNAVPKLVDLAVAVRVKTSVRFTDIGTRTALDGVAPLELTKVASAITLRPYAQSASHKHNETEENGGDSKFNFAHSGTSVWVEGWFEAVEGVLISGSLPCNVYIVNRKSARR